MKRSIAAFLAGVVTWAVAATLIDHVLRAAIDGYAAAEHTMVFTLTMKWARLAMAAAASLIAGAVTRWVDPARARAAWALGIVTLALFIPTHIKLWSTFPLWYHLTFLLTLVPFVVIGSWLARRRATIHPLTSEQSAAR